MSILTPTTIEELDELLAALLPAVPQIIGDAATGPGGLQKIVKVGGDLLGAVNTVQQVVAAHPAVTQAGAPPQS